MIILKFRQVFKQVALLLLLFALSRFLFLLFNFSYFSHSDSFLTPFVYGIRFDLVVICWLNGLLFFLLLLPFEFTEHPVFKTGYRWLFVSINALALLFNCIDIAYFEFIQKRSTYDLFQTLGGEHDGIQLLPQYIADYWFVLLIWILLIVVLVYFSRAQKSNLLQWSFRQRLIQLSIVLFVFLPLTVIGARGGWQYRPLDMIGATHYAQGKNVALVLNSPFCIMKSANKKQLEKVVYFQENKLSEIYTTYHQSNDSTPFVQKNVVLIIMESIGSEYTALAKDKKSLTPVLDSLSQVSSQYVNAFANGKTSIKGIPAIVAGIPTLFDGSFTYSAYNANSFESVTSALKKKGYSSSFYHGGNNGTMGFDVFARAAGFDYYYGKNEYPDKKDDDGNWGIYDEPFFQFFKKGLDAEKKPFVACFFSLSSHHPYSLPEKYKDIFKGNSLAIGASVQYADYALGQFFKAARKSDWYNNTIFVITADHTSMSKNEYYQSDVGIYRIPLLIFDPSKSQGAMIEKTAQQIDIYPTILEILHYDLPYFAFGNSLVNNKATYAVSYSGQFYQLITDKYCLQFDGEKTIALFDIKQDQLLKKNLIKEKGLNYRQEEELIKAVIQTYNQRLLDNKMTVD